ncbi:antibiotic biosynthesis monooxygenase family protein [Heyndrickxia ginsengihumi]|uniref:Antibiotic biosynthesis monooxygenase n=1 Tax=Heyndrickxia ginsengihumi TaxID=363870 RepID=A0A0A6VE58_9BACI|nr:antibiotic biosynthesis monooxygenase [Heyndrickxia ginsengihumi]KHD85856.1 antibiotic biosynthesis monooxygenase [Heyndrickxia ginsengihumi]MBE6185011.1 antibiotic biosynthesis monooxygenase [Bacillus sp. (in: firmicutes)]MCM3023960.1 antibiotic biosynthesis monooxygenase [Heyndrickxia ginsengihumi]NEY21232.1 antibiotic biosynthesis monooxygenase [Heyndrickxia ginsengihumi]
MFIMHASFEGSKENEDRLIAKCKKTKAENAHAEGILSTEIWRKKHRDRIEYAIVTKWESEENFKAWISREEHVQEHREMQKAKKEGTPQVQLKKTLRSYELADI